MKNIWKFLYSWIFIPVFRAALIVLSLLRSKIRRGIRGRKNLFVKLEEKVAEIPEGSLRLWFHSSSMGEFEQAKPIISRIKEKLPDAKVIVSFFSPSGYENNLNYSLADIITYIPLDSHKNAERFVRTIDPDYAVLMRYDIWPNHLWELEKHNVPIYLVDATLSKHSARKLPVIKNFHKYLFKSFTGILTVSKGDAKEFEHFDLKYPVVQAIGDTRYDQVYLKSMKAKEKKLIPSEILKDKKVLIAGSSWAEDEKIIFPVFYKLNLSEPNLLLILVPHEPTEENLDRIENDLKNKSSFIRFSQLLNYNQEKIIIIDCIGLLLSLYTYGHIAYVGGGFGEGIHNTLEPATYAIPVIFGPRNENSQEAQHLIKIGGGFMIHNESELSDYLTKFFKDENSRIAAGNIAGNFVKENIGATDKIFDYLKRSIKT
jgi:3-deoxy-D-manno-octulosonic-acid transferase